MVQSNHSGACERGAQRICRPASAHSQTSEVPAQELDGSAAVGGPQEPHRLLTLLSHHSPSALTCLSLDGCYLYQNPYSLRCNGNLSSTPRGTPAANTSTPRSQATALLHRLFPLEGRACLEEILDSVLGRTGDQGSCCDSGTRSWQKVLLVPLNHQGTPDAPCHAGASHPDQQAKFSLKALIHTFNSTSTQHKAASGCRQEASGLQAPTSMPMNKSPPTSTPALMRIPGRPVPGGQGQHQWQQVAVRTVSDDTLGRLLLIYQTDVTPLMQQQDVSALERLAAFGARSPRSPRKSHTAHTFLKQPCLLGPSPSAVPARGNACADMALVAPKPGTPVGAAAVKILTDGVKVLTQEGGGWAAPALRGGVDARCEIVHHVPVVQGVVQGVREDPDSLGVSRAVVTEGCVVQGGAGAGAGVALTPFALQAQQPPQRDPVAQGPLATGDVCPGSPYQRRSSAWSGRPARHPSQRLSSPAHFVGYVGATSASRQGSSVPPLVGVLSHSLMLRVPSGSVLADQPPSPTSAPPRPAHGAWAGVGRQGDAAQAGHGALSRERRGSMLARPPRRCSTQIGLQAVGHLLRLVNNRTLTASASASNGMQARPRSRSTFGMAPDIGSSGSARLSAAGDGPAGAQAHGLVLGAHCAARGRGAGAAAPFSGLSATLLEALNIAGAADVGRCD